MVMVTKDSYKHVFCLEGGWGEGYNSQFSVEPILELLEKYYDNNFTYIRKGCATKPEMKYFLDQWGQEKYAEYPILYLAFHGEKKQLILEDGTTISLNEIAKSLKGKCTGKIIIFGSCSTLNIDKHDINDFVKTTGALAVCGYKTDIDWMQSAAHNLLMFEVLQYNEYSKKDINAIKNNLEKIANQFKDLEFELVTINEI